MGLGQCKILQAKVMHSRIAPKKNKFVYKQLYFAVPLGDSKILNHRLGWWSKFGLIKFRSKDYGLDAPEDLTKWLKNFSKQHGLRINTDNVVILAQPRCLGYIFNPLVLWLVFDGKQKLTHVLAEVHNTFGEQHFYFIDLEKQHTKSTKEFYVSPFMSVEGQYEFRFKFAESSFGTWIDYYVGDDLKLQTSLAGQFCELSTKNLNKLFLQIPLATLKTIFFIHFQALILWWKKIKLYERPKKSESIVSKCR